MNEETKKPSKTDQLINKIVDFVKSPKSIDDFSFIPHKELISALKEFNSNYLILFFNYFSEIKSLTDIYNIIKYNKYIWKIFPENELNDLKELIKKHGINEEKLTNEILNSISIYFVYSEMINLPKSEKFKKLKEAFLFLNIYQKTQKDLRSKFRQLGLPIKINNYHLKDPILKGIEKVPTPLFDFVNYLKAPKHRIFNQSTNFLIAKITDAAKEANIKNNFTEFTIPLINELKIKYPNFFAEIINTNTDYISNRAKEGRKLYSEKSQD